jgi:hypothetical protein
MNLGDLKQMVWDRIDDAPLDLMVIRWMENGQSRLASVVNAVFPPFVTNGQFDPTFTPVFDAKWHEALVIFACARYKESESSMQEVQNFQQQFDDLKKEFAERYQVPVQNMDNDHSQQFTNAAGVTEFTITKDGFDKNYSNLKVYINGKLQVDWTYTNPVSATSTNINNFTLGVSIPTLMATDIVTAVWDNQNQFAEPPYPFWTW